MIKWPDHFPEQCPPVHASPVSGNVFRFISRNAPKHKDFVSFFSINPSKDWGDNSCQANGLSVYSSNEVCAKMAKMIPALAKKKLAVAELNSNDGYIANTPSNNTKHHKTLWPLISPENLAEKFSSIPLEVSAND